MTVCLAGAGASAQVAPGWTLTRIADSGTALPGGGAIATNSPYTLMTNGTTVVFSSDTGVYRWSEGALEAVADLTTPLPNFKTSMNEFGPPALDADEVYFIAGGTVDGSPRRGIYRAQNGAIGIVADTGTPSPHGGTFVDFLPAPATPGNIRGSYIGVHNGNVAFAGIEADRFGVYVASSSGVITNFANSITPFPGTTLRIRQYFWPTIDHDDVVFGAVTSTHGQYARIGGDYVAIARSGTPAPEGGFFGSGLGTPEIHNGRMLFFAYNSGNPGVYRWSPDSLELLLNENTLLPGETGPTTDIPGFAFDRGRVSVVATGANGDALFAEVNGAMRRIVDSHGTLDGREVDSLYIETTGFERRTLVFTAYFNDGTLGFYRVQPICLADWNLDAAANSQDFFDFLTAFFSGNADFNEDDVTNSQDFFDYLAVFFTGCIE